MKSFRVLAFLVAIAALSFFLARPLVHIQAASSGIARPQTDAASNSTAPTWSHDIAPIIYKNCTTCHHPGGAGPFSLLTYADAKRWAPQILRVTQSRFMPPWLPEPGYGDFADVRRLSEDDRTLLKRWNDTGLTSGDLNTAPPAPQYNPTWQLGKPDLVLTIARPIQLPAGGTDVFENAVFPYPLKQTHYIRAMEIRPTPASIVHHANVLIDRTASLRAAHADWRNGIPGMELLMDAGNRFDPDSHFLFWKPDTPALIEPDGMPWRLDPGNDLVLNIHMKPSGKPETVTAEIGLYFTPDPPSKQPMLLQLDGDDQLNIPAGDASFVVKDSLTLPVDVRVLGVYPHAHYLGRDMQGWAILPNGDKKWLVWIKDWDINRQSVYRYRDPLLLPAGTVLHMSYVYDNSAANPHNPSSPPVRVHSGNRSADEMSHLWLQVLPVSTSPNGPDPRLKLEEAWMRNRLSKIPNDPVTLYNLASALAAQGEFTEAIADYQKDIKLDPRSARTMVALAAAMEGAGQTDKAVEQLDHVIAMGSPSSSAACDARFNLARLHVHSGAFADAEKELRQQLSTCTEDAETHSMLGAALLGADHKDEAAREFQRALSLNPTDFTALYNLGALSLQAGDVAGATPQLEGAIRSWSGSPDAHEKLAAAYAQLNRLRDALTQLQAAAELAPNDATVHDTLAQVLDSLGRSEEAFTEQKRALALDPQDADGWNNLGAMLARGGQTAAARAAYERALKIQPDHAQAKANLARLPAAN